MRENVSESLLSRPQKSSTQEKTNSKDSKNSKDSNEAKTIEGNQYLQHFETEPFF